MGDRSLDEFLPDSSESDEDSGEDEDGSADSDSSSPDPDSGGSGSQPESESDTTAEPLPDSSDEHSDTLGETEHTDLTPVPSGDASLESSPSDPDSTDEQSVTSPDVDQSPFTIGDDAGKLEEHDTDETVSSTDSGNKSAPDRTHTHRESNGGDSEPKPEPDHESPISDRSDSDSDSDSGHESGQRESSSQPVSTDSPIGTYQWTPSSSRCNSCQDTVRRHWSQDGEFVCSDCKEW